MNPRRIPWVSVAFIALAPTAIAQTDGQLQFEVASIKPAAPDARGMYALPGPGGGISFTNMTLKEMIAWAWRIQPFQISGGPPWIDSIHYDVVAKPESRPQRSEIAEMVKALLRDRFQLNSHIETKELSVYALVLANRDGKFGPGLTKAKDGSCTQPDPAAPPGPAVPQSLSCGQFLMNPARFTAVSIPVSRMIPMLSRILGRTVLDRTGLSGDYDVSVEWAPEQNPGLQLSADGPALAVQNSDRPSIFTAFQEQLGLKLESAKGPVEIFVVDGVNKPSEN